MKDSGRERERWSRGEAVKALRLCSHHNIGSSRSFFQAPFKLLKSSILRIQCVIDTIMANLTLTGPIHLAGFIVYFGYFINFCCAFVTRSAL